MNDVRSLREYVIEKIKLHPDLKNSIKDFFQLALDEIEEGGSVTNECSLAYNSIEELITENEN